MYKYLIVGSNSEGQVDELKGDYLVGGFCWMGKAVLMRGLRRELLKPAAIN